MFIEGFYVSAGVMRARVDPINYPTLCDSVTLAIHQDFTPFNVAYTIPGLLDIYGNATFPMQQVQCGSYYLAIRHLSGIETWCKSPFIVGNPATNFDLSR